MLHPNSFWNWTNKQYVLLWFCGNAHLTIFFVVAPVDQLLQFPKNSNHFPLSLILYCCLVTQMLYVANHHSTLIVCLVQTTFFSLQCCIKNGYNYLLESSANISYETYYPKTQLFFGVLHILECLWLKQKLPCSTFWLQSSLNTEKGDRMQ